ncbi:hypothetical protein FFWV33_00620 [Flavobacterium faecale]|uniref:GTP-binding protein n=1 Tax=Flavobacterium faecale TaxID=1355330 RepID=A0A2S1L8R7_9FLAO|nr:hypothetical protein [Flavobacterium faecale]AWG20127.1 hypothetical protein FFWV33_00620 [Flavobacterium faecale]
MEVDHEVRLLLRFYNDVPQPATQLEQKFKDFKALKNDKYFVKTSRDHVWLHIIGPEKKYYSPHLHLEFEPTAENQTHIRGLYGPDQTLWTFFMFLHFILGGLFLVFLCVLYSNYILKNDLMLDYFVLGILLSVWIILYFVARQIRHNGNDQMKELEKLYLKIIEN